METDVVSTGNTNPGKHRVKTDSLKYMSFRNIKKIHKVFST